MSSCRRRGARCRIVSLKGEAVRELVAKHQAEVDELLVGIALVAQTARDALAGGHGAAGAVVLVVAAGLAKPAFVALVADGVLEVGAGVVRVLAVLQKAVDKVEVAGRAQGVSGLHARRLLELA